MAEEEELDEEEEAYGDVNVVRPGLGLGNELAGAKSGVVELDFSGKGGCGG